MSAPAIRPDSRLAMIGGTGTGKSTLARWLFATQFGRRTGHRWRVLVDAQDVYELVPEKGVWQGHGEPDWRAEVIRWVPRNPAEPEEYEELYGWLNRRPGVLTWNDEATLSSPQGARVPAQRTYQVAGRKYHRAHIVCSQFPVNIDRTFIDQAEHLFVFQLRRPSDTDHIGKAVGLKGDELRDRLRALPPAGDGRPSHHFLWWSTTRDGLLEREPLTPGQLAQADKLVRAIR